MVAWGQRDGIVPAEANSRTPSLRELEAMVRRRCQNPRPSKEGNFWYLRIWQNVPSAARKRERIKLAPASMPEREVRKLAAEKLRSVNRSIITAGSAVNFMHFVDETYTSTLLPLLASSTQKTYSGAIRKYLKPAFGGLCLRDLTPAVLQVYFSGLHTRGVAYPTILKLRDALSSILRAALQYEFLSTNPMERVKLPPDKRGRQQKPWISPAEFTALLAQIPEPYASMVFVATWTGLRISEILALKWRCVHTDSITIEQRFCRGDWSCTKTPGSAMTIPADPEVFERIQRLKTLTVDVRAGRSIRHYRVTKTFAPDDLVFQSVKDGKPMSDGNILKRYIKPAAERLGLARVHWRSLRTSCATWMVQAGADPKSVQGQMRHSRIQTTLDIYAQFVPEGQRLATKQLRDYVERALSDTGSKSGPILVQ